MVSVHRSHTVVGDYCRRASPALWRHPAGYEGRDVIRSRDGDTVSLGRIRQHDTGLQAHQETAQGSLAPLHCRYELNFTSIITTTHHNYAVRWRLVHCVYVRMRSANWSECSGHVSSLEQRWTWSCRDQQRRHRDFCLRHNSASHQRSA